MQAGPFASVLLELEQPEGLEEGDERAEVEVDPLANLQSIQFCWQGKTAGAGQHLQHSGLLHE